MQGQIAFQRDESEEETNEETSSKESDEAGRENDLGGWDRWSEGSAGGGSAGQGSRVGGSRAGETSAGYAGTVAGDEGAGAGEAGAGAGAGAGGSEAGGSGGQGWTRWRRSKIGWIPPPKPPREEEKCVIAPNGDGSWFEPNFPGVGYLRQVNKILGNICRMLWPGMVELVSGERIPATSWNHYRYGVNITFGNTQKAVWAEFWKYYKLPEEGAYDDHARRVFHHNAHIVVRDMISYARIQEMIPWMATREEAYHALCHYWTTDEFKSISQRNRGNCGTESYHTYGGDGHFRLAKK
ncbi:hypothetical protein GQ55_4G243900 [Panicum hallii var. hallii]|uniref:Uncharacterized protein n=1 Tax=Panicum hallii var. hallii TaxID=1504633 RepID=A0A2T7DZT7_9POAL|nr:hypothetical protein GQ55_4G243900 [Panicum hallii var. hallii]